ncbi:hypothetical protein AAMO2058_000697100 [Amorphochlora amoebiformis]
MVLATRPDMLNDLTTEELKKEILARTDGRNSDKMGEKTRFYERELEPLISELSKRNPIPDPKDQIPVVQGTWTPVWSTIPFQDALPGRVLDESYQIFKNNGYYANMARYAPGSNWKLGWLKFASFLLALDLIIIQKYGVVGDRWDIENVAIKQSIRFAGEPLSIEKANKWFDDLVPNEAVEGDVKAEMSVENVDTRATKRLNTAFQSKPVLEHLYIDDDFRVVLSKREENMRPSYTIAVRRGPPTAVSARNPSLLRRESFFNRPFQSNLLGSRKVMRKLMAARQ